MAISYARRTVLLQPRQPHAAPPPPPQTLLKRHAVDVSNFTDRLYWSALQDWKNQYDVGLVIVQSLDSGRFPQSRTVEQLIACHAAGITCDLYVYPFFANGEQDCSRRLSEARNAGVPIRRVWLDVEDVDPSQAAWTPSQRADMVRRWLDACDDYPAQYLGLPSGVYTGRWYWADQRYMANSTAFSDRDLWDSDYDHVDDVDYGWFPYGGWTSRQIKQHIGTSSLGSIGGVDQNVLSDQERARV